MSSPLRDQLEAEGGTLSELTVLAPQNDPFRVDTPAGHRDAQWLMAQLDELGLHGTVHLRGLHYALLGRTKPNGSPYTNTDSDWNWLAKPAKAARWLGYLDFDRIVDQRNSPPIVRTANRGTGDVYVTTDLDVVLPDPDDLRPQVGIDIEAMQPNRLILWGEKSSLDPVLAPIAERYRADLYLTTGEPSDTLIHQMMSTAATDGRPLIVLTFSDCDPAGWQMPISLARKLQALHALKFPDTPFSVYRVGLTPDQVREYGLPSTPLKATERRAGKWMSATGIQQTEVDALAALRPEVLDEIARDAVAQFFDSTLEHRMMVAVARWRRTAQAILDAHIEANGADAIYDQAAEQIDAIRDEINQLRGRLRFNADDINFSDFTPPEPEPPDPPGDPLIDSDWTFREQCDALNDSKHYDTMLGGVA